MLCYKISSVDLQLREQYLSYSFWVLIGIYKTPYNNITRILKAEVPVDLLCDKYFDNRCLLQICIVEWYIVTPPLYQNDDGKSFIRCFVP